MRASAPALLIALLVAVTPKIAFGCAGCRNPNLPVSRLATVHLAPGEVRVSAVLSGTAVNVEHEAGCASPTGCEDIPFQPLHLHDQDIYPGELRAVAEVGVTSVLGVETHLPFRVTHTAIRFKTPEGAPYEPLDPDVHHRNETLANFGDPWLLARAAKKFGGFILTGRLGASIPLGRTTENPFALGAVGKRHQHIQFGTGTIDPVMALDLSIPLGSFELSGYGQAQFTFYENGKGYRSGSRYLTGLQAGRRIVRTLVGGAGIDLLHEGAERWDGQIQQDGNLGRTEILSGLSLTQPIRQMLLSMTARIPVARWIVTGDKAPGRLSSPLMLTFSASRTFG